MPEATPVASSAAPSSLTSAPETLIRMFVAWIYLVNTMVGVTARLVSVAVKDHDLDDHVTEGE